MRQINSTGLKLQVMAAIAAIAAIRLLEDFMDLRNIDDRYLAWSVGIHLKFCYAGWLCSPAASRWRRRKLSLPARMTTRSTLSGLSPNR